MILPESESFISFLRNLFNTNSEFAKSHSRDFFAQFQDRQSPKLTIVKCSDSRVQMESFDKTPQNEVFAIRNIGNQIKTCAGSVDFGVKVLKTPFLLIIGHSDCGAIAATINKTAVPSSDIEQELSGINIVSSKMEEAIIENINNQVDYAVKKYSSEIQNSGLTVMGALYDFKNDFGFGHGKMVMININGVNDVAKLDGIYKKHVAKFKSLKL